MAHNLGWLLAVMFLLPLAGVLAECVASLQAFEILLVGSAYPPLSSIWVAPGPAMM